MAAQLGTAYVRVVGDLSTLNKQLVANFHPSRLGKMGKVAGGAIGVGLAAGIAGKSAFDLGSQFDKEFDKIRVGTGKTGKELRGLQNEFKNVVKSVPADFGTVGDAITDVNRRLGLTGKPLQNLSRQFVQLSLITKTDVADNIRAVGRAFVDWEVPVRKQSKTLDGFFRIAQKSGASVAQIAESIQKFGSPLRTLGFSLQESAALFAGFEKAGVNTQTMVPGLKLALANLTKPTSDLGKSMADLGIKAGKPETALRQVFKLLGDSSNLSKTEKIGLAMEVFGKRAGADMAEAIRQGRFEVDELIGTMEHGKDTIDNAERQTRDFNESWKILKNRIFVGLEPLATKVFTAISDGMDKLATADFSKIGESLKLSVDTEGLDFGPVKERLQGALDAIDSIIHSWLARFSVSFGGGVLEKQLAGLAQAFQGLGNVIEGTLKLIDDLIHLRLGKAFGDLGQIVHGGLQLAIGAMREFTAPIREAAARLGRGLGGPFTAAWDAVKAVFRKGLDAALAVIHLRIAIARGAARLLGNAIQGAFSRAMDLAGAVRGVLGRLPGVITGFVGRLVSAGVSLGKALTRGIARGMGSVPDIGKALANSVIGLLNQAIPNKIPLPHAPDINLPDNPIPRFAKGGKTKHPLALVGEEGPELVRLPVGSRVFSHPESKRIAKDQGIQAFARGGIVRKKDEELVDISSRRGQPQERSETGKKDDRQLRAASSQEGKARAITSRADKLDRLHLPYVWGGGHGNVAAALKHGFDCSGAVSYALGISPQVSGNLMFYGKPGKGAVSVYANPHHTFMSINGRGFGTSKENAGGGAGWLSYNSRSGFAVRHVAGLGEAAFQGEGLKRPAGIPRKLSLGQYVTLAKQAGFPDPALAAAVFFAESKGDTKAVGDSGTSFGAAQIHWPDHKRYDKDKLKDDVRYNFKAALAISDHGKNFKPWTQYRNKAYKPFLGASPDPLPKGSAGGSSGFADYLAFWLEESEGTSGELAQINKSLSYWRKVLRRNRANNPQRASEALGHVKELRQKKKDLRETADASAYELTPLGDQIGSGGAIFSVKALQGVLDSNERKTAFAALTETLDAKGNVTPDSYTDDLAAATELRNLWDYLFGLTTGKQSLPGQGHWANAPGEQPLDRLGRPTTAAKAKWWRHADGTVSGAPRQVSVAGKPVPIIGTPKQQTYAAQQLKSARDALKSIQDEMKSEDLSVTDTGQSLSEQIQSFLASLGDLKKQFGSNFRPLQSFAGGGVVEGPRGKPKVIEAHGGEVIFDERTGSFTINVKPSEAAPTAKNVTQNLHFTTAPEDQHAVAKSALFELEAAV